MKTLGHRLLLACAGFALAALAPVTAAQVSAGPEYSSVIAKARESAWKMITSGHGSGATVAIMDRGRFVYSEAMGAADRAHNRPVDRETRFNIGSIGKMFATTAILLLVDEGKVDLDAPVVRYIPEFAMADARYRNITVRMLLNHSAGLPGSSFFMTYEPDASMRRMLLETLKQSSLKHDPGAMSMYCNDCFTLAEIVVERVSGRRYVDFLAARVFGPLDMKHTGASVGETAGNNVAEYYDVGSGKKYPREVVPVYATGGLSSTAEDLCRFGDSLIPGAKNLLSAASLKELLRPQPTPFGDKLRGTQFLGNLGWDYRKRIGKGATETLVLAKGGNTMVYSSNLQVLPAERIVVAMMVSGKAGADELTNPILAALMAKLNVIDAGGAPARPPESQPIPADLERYAGYYAIESGFLKASFDASRRHLTLAPVASAIPPLTLTYTDGFFYGPGGNSRIYLISDGGEDFMVQSSMTIAGYETVGMQKVAAIASPVSLSMPMHDETWLMRNAPPSIEVSGEFKVLQVSTAVPELPGYVDFAGLRRIERPDFASVAATGLRDQSDLALVPGDGGTWMRNANILWSSARSAPLLDSAPVTIGSGGFNEWRAAGTARELRFVAPAKGRVMVVTRDGVLYDSLVDGKEAYVPAGSYVFFGGVAGDTFRFSEIPPG